MICYGKVYECEKSYYWIINVCTILHHIKRADLTHCESGGGSSPRLRESDTHLAINHEESNCCIQRANIQRSTRKCLLW